jgi:hypothetical protein
MRGMAEALVKECAKNGLKVKITDTWRTKEEQAAVPSTNTGVRYPYSYHCWGLAFDFCRNDGRKAYDDSDGFFSKVGKIGQSLGLTWGGVWTKPQDKPHFQTEKFGTPKQLIAKYGSPDGFKKTWKGGHVVDNVKINVNGKIIEVRAINHENQNYISLRDLEKAGFTVSYDKMPVLKTK